MTTQNHKQTIQEDQKDNNYSIPFLPKDLPFNAEQTQWLGGFLAGLHSRMVVQQNSAPAMDTEAQIQKKPLTIIYGSQTGNAESVAELAAEAAEAEGMAAQVFDMDDVSVEQLVTCQRLLVVTSTYGEGEMPDNAQNLWDEISEDSAPTFDDTYFSVLALGDTSYDGFCTAGIEWDQRLEQLGAKRIADRIDCDVDYDEDAEKWIADAVPTIGQKGDQSGGGVAAAESKPKKEKSKFSRKNPLQGKLINKISLTGDGSSKETYHIEISLEDSGESYNAGDALNVIPVNREPLVDEVLAQIKGDGDETIMGADKPLKAQLTTDLEIRIPSKEFISEVAKRSQDKTLQTLLDNSEKDADALSDYLWGKDCVALLKAHPDVNISPPEFVSLCKALAPRAYSISSSIKKHENEVHLTVGSVKYENDNREQFGVCSNYLGELAEINDTIHCYFAPNKNFAVPEDKNKGMIMVGPGTGIAPFRAFLEEREMTQAKGGNWLFFGDRNEKSDFLYQEEIEAWQQSGVLNSLDLAFSRDQEEKIYVQDRMLEKGADLFDWLERGAYFYICGDAFRMAKDVDKALHTLIEEHGNLSEEGAIDYVNKLKKDKRYVRDVY